MQFRVIVGITLLALVSLFSTVKLARPTEQFVSRFAGITEIVPDAISLSERRFSSLRALLPRHGTVGYVTDQETRDYAAHERWLTVRYTLAPVLVEDNPHHAFVVGNITRSTTDLQQFLDKKNLTLLKSLGDGVLLLEGAPK